MQTDICEGVILQKKDVVLTIVTLVAGDGGYEVLLEVNCISNLSPNHTFPLRITICERLIVQLHFKMCAATR